MKRIVVLGWMLACMMACGGDGDTKDFIPIDDLAARSLETICRHGIACDQYPDLAACDDATYFKTQLLADVHAGKVVYDGHAAAACLHLYEDFGCTSSEVARTLSDSRSSCDDATKGALASGATCAEDDECLSGNCVKASCETHACCLGICMNKVGLGGDCSASGFRCENGLSCKRAVGTTTYTCVVLLPVGQPCASGDACVAGAFCVTDPGSTTKSCRALPGTGAPCPDGLCDDARDFCDSATKSCVRRIPVGHACVVGRNDCVLYARCDSVTTTCIERGRAGAACTATGDCLLGVSCEGGSCVAPSDIPLCL